MDPFFFCLFLPHLQTQYMQLHCFKACVEQIVFFLNICALIHTVQNGNWSFYLYLLCNLSGYLVLQHNPFLRTMNAAAAAADLPPEKTGSRGNKRS